MNKKWFVLVMVVVVAIFIGVTITVQQVNDPQLRRLLDQQNELLTRMKSLEQKLGVMDQSGDGTPGASGQQPSFVGGDPAVIKRVEVKIDRIAKAMSDVLSARQGVGGQAARQAPPPEDFTTVHDIPMDVSIAMGEGKAPITITSFVDLQCPFSSRFQPVIAEVVKAYPKQVKQIMKHYPLPFHKQGVPAAKAVMAAGEQGKYWEMVDLILKNQKALSDDKYAEFAEELDLNVKKFTKTMEAKSAEWDEVIKKDMILGQKVGVRGTPTYFFNGRKTKSRTVGAFKAEIDKVLEGKNEKE